MFPEPTELLLTGYSIESIWTPKSKSNTLTPKTTSQTYWPRATSHVMNGIIICVCSASAISVLQIVLMWCLEERKKNQVKKESQQSQDQWWVWLQGVPQLCHLLHQKARGREVLKVKVLWVRKLRQMTERSNPLFALNDEHSNSSLGTTKQNQICR